MLSREDFYMIKQMRQQGAYIKLQEQANALAHIQALNFESIDLPTAQRQLEELQARLDRLTHPQSDIAIAKAALDEAEARQKSLKGNINKK